ncbi:MAG: hypothetical protein MRY21_05575 [Simkaniaceae bacterium]|nr:hypothetical protein [Simkaniaceae bacterium]
MRVVFLFGVRNGVGPYGVQTVGRYTAEIAHEASSYSKICEAAFNSLGDVKKAEHKLQFQQGLDQAVDNVSFSIRNESGEVLDGESDVLPEVRTIHFYFLSTPR